MWWRNFARSWTARLSLKGDDPALIQSNRKVDDLLPVPGDEDVGLAANPVEPPGPALRLAFYPADAPACKRHRIARRLTKLRDQRRDGLGVGGRQWRRWRRFLGRGMVLGGRARGHGQSLLKGARKGGFDVEIGSADAGFVDSRLDGAFQYHPSRDGMASLM